MTQPPMLKHDALYQPGDGWTAAGIAFCLENKLVVALAIILMIGAGLYTAPFDWNFGGIQRDPVPVDAIPDLGENQQIVYTEWKGRSPQDIENQITYPLTARLLNVPGVRTVRSISMFGFSTIYVVFEEGVDFYWSRDRVQERLNAISPEELPDGVRPRLGPDATPVGQIFWYTLEGRDAASKPTGGWDLDELRSIQDWKLRYELLSIPGVAEVAPIGGFVPEYQVDVDPAALHAHGVTLPMVIKAVQMSNTDVGARTMEINSAEYIIRGLGFAKRAKDLAQAVVAVRENVPIRVSDVARVVRGPAQRRGMLDKDGAEAVGAVVVAQYGVNPMAVLKQIHARIAQLDAQGTLGSKMVTVHNPDGTTRQVRSTVTIVPFYDRSDLIAETLGTLDTALRQEVLITVLVVVWLLVNLRSSFLISLTLPLAVLLCFVAMKLFDVTANVVALAGIAIAIGTIVDMGIVLSENILTHLNEAPPGQSRLQSVYHASREVGSAIMTAVATTIVGFLPVFVLTGEQGKLYRPLAFTKTFALLASLLVALIVIPPLASWLFGWGAGKKKKQTAFGKYIKYGASGLVFLVVLVLLARDWMPLGQANGLLPSFLFAGVLIGGLLLTFQLFIKVYEPVLRFCLRYSLIFLVVPILLVGFGVYVFNTMGQELMPRLDEGAFLYMPSTTPHASIGETRKVLRKQDMAIHAIPEVKNAVGKLGRVDSPLDPAPVGMIETIINYRDEFYLLPDGTMPLYAFDDTAKAYETDFAGNPVDAPDGAPYFVEGVYKRNSDGTLIVDPDGKPFRQWRRALDPALNDQRAAWAGINSPDDIWDEIVRVTQLPGVTSASKLGPIETRNVMLQSGLKGAVGVAITGRGDITLEKLQEVGIAIEKALQTVPSIRPESIAPDRITGKPYLELEPDRDAISRYGLNIADVQAVIQAAIGGSTVTYTVEGRERYGVLVRYMRELRDTPEALARVLVPTKTGGHVPLRQLLVDREIKFRRGPAVIKSEKGALVMYVSFAIKDGIGIVDGVREAEELLNHLKQQNGFTDLPGGRLPDGIRVEFIGAYQKAIEVRQKLMVLVPAALLIIFLILYLQFKRVTTTLIVFSGVAVACSGGFLMLWLYGEPDFLNITILGQNLRDIFQVHPIKMSTAIAVGFLALFGIATDDGVVMATYIKESFEKANPRTRSEIFEAVVSAAQRRVRPCLMTTATTILALLPVLTSRGRGSDIMVPMAIPVFGGMVIELMTMFVVPVLYYLTYRPTAEGEPCQPIPEEQLDAEEEAPEVTSTAS